MSKPDSFVGVDVAEACGRLTKTDRIDAQVLAAFACAIRAQVRRTLYMAVVAGLRCNPVVRAFYDHLRGQGKPAKAVITACMRKLLTIMNAMLKHQSPRTPGLDAQYSC